MATELRRIRGPLLRWYRRQRRPLPWRDTDDPYRIWVSEIMLQQTQVATVLPYYRQFLERFPDVFALADADDDEVLGVWSGLGYYRRARALHRAAREVVDNHAGQLPHEPDQLRKLPGIGRYTAGAIASMAFDRAEPVLDGNVKRVFSRLMAVPGRDERELWAVAHDLVQGAHPGDLNQALMELGALVCTPRAPACSKCPLRRHCKARKLGRQEDYPAPKPRRPTEHVRVAVAAIWCGERVLLERPGERSPLRGKWDLPAIEIEAGDNAAQELRRWLRRRHEIEIAANGEQTIATHGILHRRLKLEALDCKLVRGSAARSAELCWVTPEQLASTPVSGATRKLLQKRSHGGHESLPPSRSSIASGPGSSGRLQR